MNVVILTVILLVVFFIIQKNSKFQDKDYPLNSASRDESFLNTFRKEFDIPTKREKRVRLIDALKNISLSDKVILTDVEEKWSLNKNTIDIETNRKSLEIVKDVMKNIGLLSKQQFFIKNIENVYVMKDKNGNFRTIISCFIHDIQNFHTIQIISIFHCNSLFKSVAPVKLPLTGATSSDLEEEARVIYLLLIRPQPLGSNPLHPKPGIKTSVHA